MSEYNDIDEVLNGLTETELIFKAKVKALRKSQPGSPTLMQTAKAIGINYGTYRLIESFTPVNVKFSTMEKIARYYKIPVNELFSL